MNRRLLLGTCLLSGFVTQGSVANDTKPWERDWSSNAGDCVAMGELPTGISCKLYAHGKEGFEMLIHIYKEHSSTYHGAEAFVTTAQRLCAALSVPVVVKFYAPDGSDKLTASVLPSDCEPRSFTE